MPRVYLRLRRVTVQGLPNHHGRANCLASARAGGPAGRGRSGSRIRGVPHDGSMHAALGLSAGYLLCRRRTRRIAAVLAAAAAGSQGGLGGMTMPGPAHAAGTAAARLVPVRQPECGAARPPDSRWRQRKEPQADQALDQDCGASCRARASACTPQDQQDG
jgi:hypothetical protein